MVHHGPCNVCPSKISNSLEQGTDTEKVADRTLLLTGTSRRAWIPYSTPGAKKPNDRGQLRQILATEGAKNKSNQIRHSMIGL